MNNNDKQFKMTFSVATNFDPALIDVVDQYNQDGQFTSVFGKLRSDIVGGGRASMVLPELSIKEVKKYIDLCHKKGLQFNYLLNPMCMENKELEIRSHKQIVKYIGELADIGVDAITINSPYLCELIKKQFPGIKVTIGLYAYIFEIQHIKYWEDLGADELTLLHGVNRNFGLLEKMLAYAKKSGIALRLIANNICLHSCPYQVLHGTGQAHASRKGHFSKNIYIDYCILKCISEKIKNPAGIIASEWIRPEDVKYYEQLCQKVGNTNFSIKLLERTKTTEFLTRVVKAYAERSYDGNLLDLVLWPKLNEVAKIHKLPMMLKAITGRYNLRELENFFDALNLPPVFVDNKKLDGFLEGFIGSFKCNQHVCDAVGKLGGSGEQSLQPCSYCRNTAQKAIEFDREEVERWIAKTNAVLENLNGSKMFYSSNKVPKKANMG